jgi:hypothetical protein
MSSSAFAIASALREHPQTTRLSVRTHTMNVLAGRAVLIAGRLLVARGSLGLPGRMITLQERAHRGWKTIARTHTSTNGRYRLRFLAERAGSEALRLRFAGDGADAASHRRLGKLNVYRLAEAWRNSSNTLGRFERCVINAESGGDRYASNGADWSYYQWTPGTYNVAASMAGLPRRVNPTEADLHEQTVAFRVYVRSNPGAWPVTVPMCR